MNAQQLLFRWFDKLILLAAVCFVAWAATRIKPTQQAKDLKRQAQSLIDKVQRNIKQGKPPALPKLAHRKALEKAYEDVTPEAVPRIKTAWYPPRDMVHLHTVMRTQSVTHAFEHPIRNEPRQKGFGNKPGRVDVAVSADRKTMTIKGMQEGWAQLTLYDTMGQRHVVVVNATEFIPDPKVFQPKAPEISLLPGSKTLKLTWEPPERVDERAPIQGYNVYRKKKGDKKFERVQLVPVEGGKKGSTPGGSYEDSNTAFGATYVYQITSYSPSAKPSESAPSAAAEKTIGSDIAFFLKSASTTAAGMKVYKWKDGRWIGKTFFTKPGEEVGAVYKGYFPVEGRNQRLTVDFRTGCYLVDIDTRAPYWKPMFGQARQMLDQRVVYQDKDRSLKEKWRFERDAAPWDRFGQEPPTAPQRSKRRSKRKSTKSKRRDRGADMDAEIRAFEEGEQRRRAEDEARQKKGADEPEELE